MTVMGMLMPVAGLIKVRYNGDKADIDSSFFKLHYRTTTTIFFISTILVTSYGMIGKPIDCMGDGIPGNVLNTYCWIMSTFSIPSKYRVIKGQIISECPYEIIVYPKIARKKFPRFLSWKFTTSRLVQNRVYLLAIVLLFVNTANC